MGFFGGLQAESYDRTYEDRELVRRMAAYFGKYRWRLVAIIAAVLTISAVNAATPILVSRGVDLMARQDSPEFIAILTGALFLMGVSIWVLNWVRRRYVMRAVGDVMMELRQDAFTAAAGHDLSFYDEFSSGRIVSRITSDTQDFAQVVVLITDLLSQVVQAVILLVVLLQTEWRLTLWVLVLLPIVFVFASLLRRLARVVTRQGFRAMANVNAAIKEAVTGIAVAKNFRQETGIYEEFDEVNLLSYTTNVKRGFVLSIVFPALNAIGGVGTAMILYLGGLSAAEGVVTVGAWYLFITSLDRFWFPILNLSAFWSQIQNGLSAAERVFALLDADPVVVQLDDQTVPKLSGEIEFDRLDFRYVKDECVLEDFSLNIAPGENLALVGHTGAGKTSIARLIARFYEFQGGRLLVDGRDIRTFHLHEYRSQLGVVSQVPFLFSGTVIDNIRYARPEASSDEIRDLALRIGNGEWLESLPDGLETEVGERGGRLSMGQRQLVSLMRVLVQRPAIFILDEATASIDPFTESQIQEALALILQDATSILIAHRLSTVQAADRIIVLKEGKILEEGNHAALMAQGGHYAELYNTYFRHQSPDYRPALDPSKANWGFVEVKSETSSD
jgi:ATP-binding cassette subfamily B protein